MSSVIYDSVIFDDAAVQVFEDGLHYMKLRTGWEFDDDILEAIIEIVRDCGIDVKNGLSAITDHMYVNGSYGYWEDLEDRDLELYKARAEAGDLLYYNDKIWIEYL